jgi:diguanylate cyclase (GGDEF)-like protein/PAS domain S-box-containing protein
MDQLNLATAAASALKIGEAENQLRETIAALQQSEARYRALANDLQVGLLIQLANSEIVLSNPKALELLGLTQDQLLGKTSMDPDWNVIHSDGTPFPGHTHPVPAAIASGAPMHNVLMGVYRPEARDRVWLLVNADPQLAADGSVLQVVCTFSDVTESHRSREALEQATQLQRTTELFQEREAFTQSILNSVSAEIAVLSRNGTIVAVNQAWRRFASENRLNTDELPRKTDVGANYLAVCAASGETSFPDTLSPAQGINAVMEGRLHSYTHEYPCHSPDRQRWFHMHVTPFEGAKIVGAVVTHTDITARKLAEISQLENETELKRAQQLAHIGSWYWDMQTDVMTTSEELCKIFGRQTFPNFAAQRGTLYTEQTWQTLNVAVQKALESGVGYNLDLPAMRADGTPIWINTRSDLALNAKQEVIGLRGTVQDITVHRATLHQLAVVQDRLQLVIDATNDGIWDWDIPSGQVFRSPRYLALVGPEHGEDTHDFDFFKRTIHPDDLAHALLCIQAHKEGQSPFIDFEYRLSTASEKTTWLQVKGRVVSRDANGVPLRLLGTLSDITERKCAEIMLREREQQLARVLAGSNQGFWDLNVQTQAFQIGARMEEMLGYAKGEVNIAMDHWHEHIHPQDLEMVFSSINRQVAGESTLSELEFRMKTKTGEWRWFLSRGRIVSWDGSGKPLMMSGTHTDITERKQFESAQKEAATVFSSSYEGIMVVSADLVITKVNPAFTRITGYSSDEALGQSPQMLSSGKHDALFFQKLWSTVNSVGFWSGEIWDRKKNGELYAALMSISAVRSEDQGIAHYVGVFSDISKFKAHEEELDRIAHYDPLTGAPNRRLLTDRLENAINRAKRTGRTLAVCFLDIDDFKAVNDTYGHASGDQVLVGVAESLKGVLRADDTLARIGGDEFVLLLSGISSTQECSQILDRILKAVNLPVQVIDAVSVVTASIGVSLFPDDNADADTLLRHADQAMYQAKEAGKNRYCLFDLASNQKAQTHRSYLDLLRAALLSEQFELHYQPKVDLRTGAIVGAEALIRWQRPGVGLVSPADFLPHINGSDLESPLGEWVIKTALAQTAQWHLQGLALCVSVNISAHHLLDAGFHAYLIQALGRHPDLPASCFELEVLETAAIADINQAVKILTNCRKLGVQFSLDDFGTGYSSLTYLRKLPIDTLKIDQSFVRDMLNDVEDMGIVEGVIRLGEAFHKNIVAEGVETMTHGKALLGMNCFLAQGYGIARPMPADLFAKWSLTWKAEQKWLQLTDMASTLLPRTGTSIVLPPTEN